MCKNLEDDGIKLTELRLDYTWKYFESAAKQRMLFLNYFLIAVGILASAYGFALKERLYPVAIFVCLFGLIASIGFIYFDKRMLEFVNRALNVLETLEREELFKDGYLHNNASTEQGGQLGLARIEPDHQASDNVNLNTVHPKQKTKYWIRLIERVAALGFFLGIIFAASLWINSNTHSEKTASISSGQKNEQQYIRPSKCGGKIRKHQHNQETHSHP